MRRYSVDSQTMPMLWMLSWSRYSTKSSDAWSCNPPRSERNMLEPSTAEVACNGRVTTWKQNTPSERRWYLASPWTAHPNEMLYAKENREQDKGIMGEFGRPGEGSRRGRREHSTASNASLRSRKHSPPPAPNVRFAIPQPTISQGNRK